MDYFKEIVECLIIERKKFPKELRTDRLFIRQEDIEDGASILYSIFLNENKKIGDIAIIYDGEVMYKIDNEYRNNGYVTEALTKIIESNNRDYYLNIKEDNKASKKVAKKLGFKKVKKIENSAIYSNIS